jgi:hypothetical protein
MGRNYCRKIAIHFKIKKTISFEMAQYFCDSTMVFIQTYMEEENCEAIFRRSGSEFIILQIPNTENGTFSGQKKTVIGG